MTKQAVGWVISHNTKVNALHADGLGSVRAVTDAGGLAVERTTYRPFGEEVAQITPLSLPETKGFIGERYDDASGLQYLNARYYDPKLAMFIQPDWWEVMKPGVGTNRYSYSFNDPVNGRDPSGHEVYGESAKKSGLVDKIRDFFDRVRDALRGDISSYRGLEERYKSGEKTGALARLGWSSGERTVFSRVAASVGGGKNVTLETLEDRRKKAERTLARIKDYGSGIKVHYEQEFFDKINKIRRSDIAGTAVPKSGEMTLYEKALSGSPESTMRTILHESAHAVLGLDDNLPGYSGRPVSTTKGHIVEGKGVWQGKWLGYQWAGVDAARALGPDVSANHTDTFVCSTSIGGC